MDATCTIQDSIHVFNLVHKYVSRILGTYQSRRIGGKVGKPGKSPNRKLQGSRRVGGKVGKPTTKPQLASGVAGTAGLFVYHVQLSVGDDGFCAGTFATVGT